MSNKYIFDEFRKKWIVLTPEEWVRQQLLMYLHIHLKYPQTSIAVERKIIYNGMARRPDAVISGKNGKILMAIECKRPDVDIDEKTFLQVATYSSVLSNAYILISNGITHLVCHANSQTNKIEYLEEIPNFNMINV